MVRFQQILCHLRLVTLCDLIILGIIGFEDDTYFDDRNACFEFGNDLRRDLIHGLGPILGDRCACCFLGAFLFLHLRSGNAVESRGLAIRKTDQNTRFIGELVELVGVNGLDDKGCDILSVLVLLAESDLRLQVLVNRSVQMDKLAAFRSVNTHTQRQNERYEYRKYLFHKII